MGRPDLADALAAQTPDGFPVWPGNMPVVDAWLVVCSQWRAISMVNGQVLWLGLDYASAKVGLDLAGTTLGPADWSSLRLMERVAKAALNGNR